ncbi:GHKL domain-containing protein [Lacrimispora amygdalina]|uniref:GHKL domain-containing protein n=1 Tax=Lacrimispora amygdalina TaxID=253257 RepID=A0A3E2N4I6_9FIRM|nr:GHKL domain-containing protein [Clostridium indicum]
MFEKVYMIMGCTELLLLMILIGKYIYFERFFLHLRSWCIYLVLFILFEILLCFYDKEGLASIGLSFAFFSALVFLTRKSKKIRGVFIAVPIAGMIFSFVIIPVSLLYLFSESMNSIIDHSTAWMWIYDVIFWIGFYLFFWKVKKRLDEMLMNRTLSNWERTLINMTGFFLFIFTMLLVCVDDFKITSFYARCFAGSGIFIIAFLEASIIAMVIQGNGKVYFQQAAVLNAHYLKVQLEHFKTYQETQRETRRVYHDMKNHISCLHNLILQGRYEETANYLVELNTQIQNIDKELYTGNDIVDAIINEKLSSAAKDQISISVDGKLGYLPVDPIDLCTIFSNAADNGIEALRDSQISDKVLEIQFKRQGEMQWIMFRNPVKRRGPALLSVTTKEDCINHGFGLGNIRMAVEKYKGHMEYRLENEGDLQYFVLEILLFVHNTTR